MLRAVRRASAKAFLVLAAVRGGCSEAPTAPTPPAGSLTSGAAPIRVLMLTATAGFRHDSIDTARHVMSSLASSTGELTVTSTEQLATLSEAGLAAFDVLLFALTSREQGLGQGLITPLPSPRHRRY